MKCSDILRTAVALLTGLFAFSSCLYDADEALDWTDESPRNVFEACWRVVDEHYCFFEEKGVDWQAVHDHYAPMFKDSIKTQIQLFNVLDEMLGQLRDGHVNLYSPFNIGRYSTWHDGYPFNFDANLLRRYYLDNNYAIAAGMEYGVFPSDTIAYVRYSSFSTGFGAVNLDYLLARIYRANGLILDIRSNGGGDLTNAVALAERFSTARTLYGYVCHKTGPGHNDFSERQPLYLEACSPQHLSWDASSRPVVILTNRSCFSAANHFVQMMTVLDGTMTTDTLGIDYPKMIRICGDHTGGGGGMPFEQVLPNGWTVRFSACPSFDAQGHSIEDGIAPSPGLRVDMDSLSAFNDHRDDIIEAARAYIINNTRAPRKQAETDPKTDAK